MKLRNKLIPIMSILASTTVVAPIATSCGNKMNDTTESVVDITSPYTPSIAKADAITEEKSIEEIQDYYMTKVMENPEIIRQDIWYFESKKLPYRINQLEHMYVDLDGSIKSSDEQQNTITNVIANINISDVEVKRVDAIIKGEKTQFYTLSMNIGYDFSFRATSLSAEPRILLDQTFKYQSSLKDVPIYLSANTDYWYCSIDLLDKDIDEYLKYVPGWYVTYDFSTGYTANISTHGLSQDFSDSFAKAGTITRRSQIYALKDDDSTLLRSLQDFYPNFGSYHLSNVKLPSLGIEWNDEMQTSITKNWSVSSEFTDVYFDEISLFKINDKMAEKLKAADSIYIYLDNGYFAMTEFNGQCDDYYYDGTADRWVAFYMDNGAKIVNNNYLTFGSIRINNNYGFVKGYPYQTSITIDEGNSYAWYIKAYDSDDNVIVDTSSTPLYLDQPLTFNFNIKFVD